MKKSIMCLLILVMILCPLLGAGQEKIIVKGKVTDQSGTPLSNANVTVVDQPYGSATDEAGAFTFTLPAEYANKVIELKAQYIGFLSHQIKLELITGLNQADFQLQRDVLYINPIRVTAQRREENVQEVPVSITAMKGDEMRSRGINRVIDLQNSIPNFFLGPGTFDRATYSSIRGIAGASRAPGVEKRANYYLDDVYMGRSIAVNMDLFDLERIELLKGPQGTLFGKNTVSGAINITTRKPANGWEGTVNVDAGNFNFVNSNFIMNVPLIEKKLFTRFSGKRMRRDGYVKNVYNNKNINGQDIFYGRFQTRYLPSPNLNINLSLDALRDRRDRTWGIALDGPGYDAAPGPREVSYNLPEFEHRDFFGGALNMEYHSANKYSIKSVSAYRKIKNWSNRDEDNSPLPYFVGIDSSEDVHFTQEIRLISPVYKKYNFVAGLFYFYQKSDQTFGVEGAPDAFPTPNLILLSQGPVKTNSIAAYIHNNWRLGSSFSLFGGIRYTYEYKTLRWSQINDSDVGVFYVNIDNYTDTYSKGIFSPQIGLQYKLQDRFLLYGKIARGYKSGGFGNHTVQDLENIKLKPEYVESFETGVKLAVLRNRVIFNTAAFLSKFDDYQTEIWLPIPFGVTLPVYTNAAKVTSKGFEMELNTNPFKNLSLMAALGYVDARYDKFTTDSEFDYDGHKLEFAPETEYTISIEYRLPRIKIGVFTIRGDFIHKDDYYSDANNEEDYHIAAYDLINGRIGYESLNGSLGMYLWGKNLTDKLYMLARGITPPRVKVAWYAMPRTLGVGITYRFF